jgi:hypothetical protein
MEFAFAAQLDSNEAAELRDSVIESEVAGTRMPSDVVADVTVTRVIVRFRSLRRFHATGIGGAIGTVRPR